MVKEKISFNIEETTKKKVKVIASIKGVTATELYNKWIKEGIENEGINLDSLITE